MAQRLSISVPEDLAAQIKSSKSKLNVSKICQEAIMQAIEMVELKDRSQQDLDVLTTRLKKEREIAGQEFKTGGFEDGSNDAHKMSFEDIHFIYLHQDAMSPEELFDWGASKETRESITSGQSTPVSEINADGRKVTVFKDYSPFIDFDEVSDLYYRGWLDGTLYIYNQVREKLTSD